MSALLHSANQDRLPANRFRFNGPYARDALAALMLLGVVAALYGGSVFGWWRWDDPAHVRFAMNHYPTEYFSNPAIWRQISPVNLTPWLTLAYDTDLVLFGLQPFGYYLHHVTVIWVVSIATYGLLRLWMDRLSSLLGVLLFVVGAPVATVAEQLMTRHYVEGLLFAIVACYCYVRSVREDARTWAWGGAAFYALAVAAKEVYVPLVCMLPLLREGKLRRRIVLALPFGVVVLGYIPWRWYMLDLPFGGYTGTTVPPSLGLLRGFVDIPRFLLGTGVPGVLGFVALGCLVVIALVTRRLHPFPVLGAIALVLAPLVPLASYPGIQGPDRYLFLLWWVVCCGVAFATNPLSHFRSAARVLPLAAYVVLAGAVLHQTWMTKAAVREAIAEIEAQGAFVWNADESQTLFVSSALAASFWNMTNLVELKAEALPGTSTPRLVVDEIQLQAQQPASSSVWSYDAACRCVRDVTMEVPARLALWAERRVEKPLSVHVIGDGDVIAWRLGPYTQGRYSVIGDRLGKVPVPAHGQRRIEGDVGSFRLRYDDPSGWLTYSELLSITDGDVVSVGWRP